jgi:hypothetical protein
MPATVSVPVRMAPVVFAVAA